MTSFSKLNIEDRFLSKLSEMNISEPTEIQEKAIPVALETSKDIVAEAKTGTGKTLAFGLPILQTVDVQDKQVQTVILAPTRELGQQIANVLKSVTPEASGIGVSCICGGVPIKPQIEELKLVPQIVVATPGRLVDLMNRGAVDISKVKYFVLDEADEMIKALKESLDIIIKGLPKARRTFLFTATFSGPIKNLVHNYMSDDLEHLSVDMKSLGHQGIEHKFVVVEPIEKLDVLTHFLNSREGQRGIIFCKTKAAVNKLAKKLAINKFSSGAMHGSLSQAIRDRILNQFRDGHINILVATDLVARGIDIKDLDYVVNYHLPDVYEAYVHRTGRTARAGAKGFALTIIQDEELEDIDDFEDELGIEFTAYSKASEDDIDLNKAKLWAKKIFKTKPNRDVDSAFKTEIKTIFHHLSKDELVEKILAQYLIEQDIAQGNKSKSNTK
ncbi:MAG: DEAD/DEAH box helicase [Bacteroidetes bacterium MedPE-SWsnd-G2]|nr:MAG: DEAD/DEAH box helicase [Bacteroidetes bacterium MedPE-SWsnd-G2]